VGGSAITGSGIEMALTATSENRAYLSSHRGALSFAHFSGATMLASTLAHARRSSLERLESLIERLPALTRALRSRAAALRATRCACRVRARPLNGAWGVARTSFGVTTNNSVCRCSVAATYQATKRRRKKAGVMSIEGGEMKHYASVWLCRWKNYCGDAKKGVSSVGLSRLKWRINEGAWRRCAKTAAARRVIINISGMTPVRA